MNMYQGIKMALGSIMSNKLRAFLTMLGIMIGVASVISLVSLGQGSTQKVTEQVQSLGSNLLTVNVTGRGAQTSLSYDEVLTLQEKPGIDAVAPVVSSRVTVKAGNKNTEVTVEGTDASYETVRDFHAQEGRFLLPIDVQFRQKVALLGASTAEELFGFVSPLNNYVQINGIPFKVVGVLEEKGDSMSGANDEKVIIPISTAERILASPGVRTIYVQAESPEQVEMAEAQLEAMLTKKFKGDEDSYRIFNQQDLLESVSSVNSTLTMMLSGIAGISLLVGGIGIMNIMLVSVTERTREIGIRKAIGAKKRDILFQFLIESVVLSGLGGLIGVALGVGGAYAIGHFSDTSVVFSWDVTLLSFGFSLFVGIFFGLFPANKAANLKPIEALRFE
ncbi:MAG: ABC transporter permease [Brevibacillus sp.]|nr:ABC transporter permease [Brevibacillus sp.]